MSLVSKRILDSEKFEGSAYPEVTLESLHLLANERGLKHGNSSLLERSVGSTVKVGTTRADSARRECQL